MTKKNDAPFAYEGLDRVLHERARLSIMTSLMTQRKGLSFAELKNQCDLSDGNLSRHLQVLEDNGYVAVKKDFVGRRPQTTCKLTASGTKAFTRYLDVLEQVVRDAGQLDGVKGKPAKT